MFLMLIQFSLNSSKEEFYTSKNYLSQVIFRWVSYHFSPLDYVGDIYETMTTTPRAELKLLEEELKGEVPDHLHSLLEKESKEEAVTKYQARKEKETVIVPPTCAGNQN